MIFISRYLLLIQKQWTLHSSAVDPQCIAQPRCDWSMLVPIAEQPTVFTAPPCVVKQRETDGCSVPGYEVMCLNVLILKRVHVKLFGNAVTRGVTNLFRFNSGLLQFSVLNFTLVKLVLIVASCLQS